MIFEAPDGEVVPTFTEDCVPFLGEPDGRALAQNVFTLVNSTTDIAEQTVADMATEIEKLAAEKTELQDEVRRLTGNLISETIHTAGSLVDDVPNTDVPSANPPRTRPTAPVIEVPDDEGTREPSAPSKPPTQRRYNPVSKLEAGREDDIPIVHLFTRRLKGHWCFGCEIRNMKRAPSYRQVVKPALDYDFTAALVAVVAEVVSEIEGGVDAVM